MINANRVTSGTNIPEDMLAAWDTFRVQHRTISYHKTLEAGTSQCLAEACTELATCYQNNVVENFEAHLLKFLVYQLQHTFTVSCVEK
jgi:hypothetical protein